MGNNEAYTRWEHTVVTLYDKGVLTLELLDGLSEEYRGTDIDSGGSRGLVSRDGQTVEEIAVKLVKPDFRPTIPDLPEDDDAYWEDYWDYADEFVCNISHERWGWC